MTGSLPPNGRHPVNDAAAIERVTCSLVAIGYDENEARAWATAKLGGEEPPSIQLPAGERVRVWSVLARARYAGTTGEIIPIE